MFLKIMCYGPESLLRIFMCTESQRRRGPFITTGEVERSMRWGKAHSEQRKGSEREFKKIQGHGTNIPKWLTDGRWDQAWVGWEQTVKGHECPDKEFGLYPLDFWGPSGIFFTQGSPQPLSCSVHCCQPPLMVFWASQEQGQHDLITFLFRNITGHFTHCTVGTVPPATGFDDTWLKLLLVYAVDTDDQFSF